MLFLCPICAGEFEADLSACPGCGVKLVPGIIDKNKMGEVINIREEPREIEFEELCRPTKFEMAMLIKQTLEQNGVTVIVQGGHSMSVMPSLSFIGQLRVLVDREQIDYARELYRAYFEGEPADYDFEDEFPEQSE